jgi:polysaccharide export outer membrane protein
MCGPRKREWNVATRYASGSIPSNEVIHSGFAMTTFFGTLSRAIAAIALVSSLGACALSPGMTFNANQLADPLDPNSKAVIKEITPSLVLEDQRARQALLDNEGIDHLFGKPGPYLIGPGDILSIVVWDHPELVLPTQTYAIGSGATELAIGDTASGIPGYTVSSTGYIQFPYTGLLKVAGLTELQARNLIVNSSGKYIQDPQITVRVLGFRSKRIFVDGAVTTPGTVAINDVPMTLLEGINRAGGILPTGDRSAVFVIREGKRTRVNLPALIERGQDLNQVMLKPGDIVRVTPRDDSKIFVMGEVFLPSAPVMRDGRMSLTEALALAGGPNQLTSDPSQIFVVRSTEDATPLVFHLNAGSPQALAVAEKFELQPKDVVFVDSAGLVRWNRFISNLFPSAQTVQTVKSID